MGKKIEVESGNPYRDDEGRFDTADGVGTTKSEDTETEDSDSISVDDIAAIKVDSDILDSLSVDDIVSLDLDSDLMEISDEARMEDIANSTVTLKNQKKARENRKKEFERTGGSLKVSVEDRKKFQDTIYDIYTKNTLFTARIPIEHLLNCVEDGEFKNQFGVKHTEGYAGYLYEDGGSRGRFTARNFGTERNGVPAKICGPKWEKYGTCCPKDDLAGFFDGKDGAKSQYGSCFLLFDTDKLFGRITITLSDSLTDYDMTPAKMHDKEQIDEFIMHGCDRKTVFNKVISGEVKNVFDLNNITSGRYIECQYHMEKMNFEDCVSALCIPYEDINTEDAKKSIALFKSKYPSLKVLTKSYSGKVKEVSLNDKNEIVYGDEFIAK